MPSKEIICLVADPDEQVRALLEASLGSSAASLGLDILVLSVDDGRAALQAIRTRTPALVLSEVLLEVVNGLQLLRHCRDSVDTEGVRWIFVTAMTDDTDRYWARLNDCDDYLHKPIDGGTLSTVLKRHLEAIAGDTPRVRSQKEGLFR